MELPIYLDHAATTPVDPEVLSEMYPFFAEVYGNPAAIYSAGVQARDAVEQARVDVADAIGATPEEICFTSGGTEADNWAIKGVVARTGVERPHVLTTPIEHHAVLDTCLTLRDRGIDVEMLPVDAEGWVEPGEVARRIQRNTVLVSVMHANNEVGTIEPIEEIGAVCRERGTLFHTDAVQTLGKLDMDVRRMHADLVSLSAHKIYGPKGAGALYIRAGTSIGSFMEGGGQEKGRRAGTLNVPAAVGFGSAVRLAGRLRQEESDRLTRLRDRLIEGVLAEVPGVRLSGSRKRRLPNNAHFCIPGVEGESLLLALDAAGIYASAGSACTTGSPEPSHVLLAMGLGREIARGALRLTLGRSTDLEAVDYTIERLAQAIQELRRLGTAIP